MGNLPDSETASPSDCGQCVNYSDSANTTIPYSILGSKERSWPSSLASGNQEQNIPYSLFFKEEKKDVKEQYGYKHFSHKL